MAAISSRGDAHLDHARGEKTGNAKAYTVVVTAT